ncbi:MAG TPA: MYXO-CTERM sorting domain-containing protein, partial [Myxococcota bacterium]
AVSNADQADRNDDGVGDACGARLGVNGGGLLASCASTDGAPTGVFGLALLAMGLRRRRRR